MNLLSLASRALKKQTIRGTTTIFLRLSHFASGLGATASVPQLRRSIGYLPACMKAPLVALTVQMPFRSA